MKEDSVMNVLQAIKERRSVRQYTPEPVPEEQVTQIGDFNRLPSRSTREGKERAG
jgi:hypothetical protein